MKNKLFIKIILLATVGILTACTNQNSPSNANSATTTEITSSETTTMEVTTTSTPVTELKSETELSLIELSRKSFNEYTSGDYKFLLNTDRTSYIKAFDLKLDNGKAGVNSPDGWLRLYGSTASDYIMMFIPIQQITIDIMPPANFSPEVYLKPTTVKPYIILVQLKSEDVLFGKIKSGMTMDQVSNELDKCEIVSFGEEPRDPGYFIKYECDGLLYEFCFPDYNKNRLEEIYISKI